MFTAVAQKNLADAEGYFDEQLAQNDYYAAGEIRPGQWIGAGAERLGLNNVVTRDQFHALCENQNPNDGKRLTLRQEKANQRRVFYDFTCSAPKSVSVLAVTMEDDRLVSAHDRITGLRGLAGSGKTTALRELAAACKEAKVEPLFCAPTAAATDVLRKEGFEAKTLQSLLLTKPKLNERKLVVLDEAGAVGIDDMKRLFDLAHDARIILSGDTGQHASVARGDALRILERHSNFKSGQLTAIRRQRKAAYRKAVELAAQKRTVEAFAQLERIADISWLDKVVAAIHRHWRIKNARKLARLAKSGATTKSDMQ